ncbi:MAG: TonB-dependent receptor, partial [Myxococcota bacterium]
MTDLHRQFRVLRALAILLIAVATLPSVVRADERTEARRHFRAGMRLIEAGQNEPGIAELEEAYAILPHPNVLFNIARAYVELERWPDAVAYFERYLASDPPDAAEVEAVLEELRARVSEAEDEAAVPAARPSPSPSRAVAVSEGELTSLEEAATRFETLAEATGSEELRAQAAELRALRAGLSAAPATTEVPEAAVDAPSPVSAQDETPPAEAPESEALALDVGSERGDEIYQEQVISASRAAQSRLNAPNSLAVVTAQDLRLGGVAQPFLSLRRVAGIELQETSPGNVQLSVRGLNQRISNRAVVLIDGRSVYLDFLGGTFANLLPINTEDIERIEVVRGPASALYGADAFTGVVNVITRPVGEGGTYMSLMAGNQGQLRAAAGTNVRRGPFGLRLTGGYEQADQYARTVAPERVDRTAFAESADLALNRLSFTGDGELRLDDVGLVVKAGTAIASVDSVFQGLSRLRELNLENGRYAQSYVSARSETGLSGRVFWNRFSTEHGNAGIVPNGIERGQRAEVRRADVVDVELLYQNDVSRGAIANTLIVGGGYRFKEVDWDWLLFDEDQTVRTQHHGNAFLQNTFRYRKLLEVVLSGRVDRHPLLSRPQLSPRGALLLHPTEQQTVRLSAGTAFRAPTFVESYVNTPNGTPVRGITALGVGNTDLDPERMVSFELGYLLQESEYFSLETNAYFNLVSDQIFLSDDRRFRLYDAATDPAAGYSPGNEAFALSELRWENEAQDFEQFGGELIVRVFPVDGLDLYANYAFHETRPRTGEPFGGRELDDRT